MNTSTITLTISHEGDLPKGLLAAIEAKAYDWTMAHGVACGEVVAKEAKQPDDVHCTDGACSECSPMPDFADAYQGAREDVAIWKRRALEAEEINRRFIADINGKTFMGEPAPGSVKVRVYTTVDPGTGAILRADPHGQQQQDDQMPMQPMCLDPHGVVRFKENRIVSALYEHSRKHGYGLNETAQGDFTADEHMQLAQLIGYSLSGYGELSYVTDEAYEQARATAERLLDLAAQPQPQQGEPVVELHCGRHVGSAKPYLRLLAAADRLPDGKHLLYAALPPAPPIVRLPVKEMRDE